MLVYIILYGDFKWKVNMYVEWEFFLYGYWKFVVYNYEKMMVKDYLGYGDERWFFVIYFVGCKFCKLGVNVENDECFK